MSARTWFRIASVLIVLFALGHTLGFRNLDPAWHVEGVVSQMQSVHFQAQGFSRSYYDFFAGFGLFVSAFLVFAAVVAWQLGSLRPEHDRHWRVSAWTLALLFCSTTALSWRYFFVLPIAFSGVISVCLLAGAWMFSRPAG